MTDNAMTDNAMTDNDMMTADEIAIELFNRQGFLIRGLYCQGKVGDIILPATDGMTMPLRIVGYPTHEQFVIQSKNHAEITGMPSVPIELQKTLNPVLMEAVD